MKRSVLGLILLVAGCSGATLPYNAIEGGPGQDISVAIAGLEQGLVPPDGVGSRSYVLQFEVSNNSNLPVTVTRIAMSPADHAAAFQVQQVTARFNEMIDPGDDHLFELRLEGRQVRSYRQNESRTVEIRISVSLANEETYFYAFEVPVRF